MTHFGHAQDWPKLKVRSRVAFGWSGWCCSHDHACCGNSTLVMVVQEPGRCSVQLAQVSKLSTGPGHNGIYIYIYSTLACPGVPN